VFGGGFRRNGALLSIIRRRVFALHSTGSNASKRLVKRVDNDAMKALQWGFA
jgi:hypothetical protein